MIRDTLGYDDESCERLRNHLNRRLHPSFARDQIQAFTTFLRRMLQSDPRRRSSPQELPADPWLVGQPTTVGG